MKTSVFVGPAPKQGGEKYLTRKEVAAKFGVDPRTIDNWREKYGMPHYRIGGQVRFVESQVDAWSKTMRRGKPVLGMA